MEEVQITQPPQINIPLFLHQLKSIEKMETLEKTKEIELSSSIYITTQVGVLADLPGYGKSLSILGLIARSLDTALEDTYPYTQTVAFPYVAKQRVELLQQVSPSLILVNVSLISQWIQELSRTLLRHFAVHRVSEIEDIDLTAYDVILVGNNVYNLFSQVYKKKAWRRFIIDEPASLKLPAMETSYAPFYWMITGTPHELYQKRRTGFLNELLPDDQSDIFQHLILKNDDHFVKSSYEMPITRHLYYRCVGNPSEFFEGIVSDAILEMIQAGNMTGVFNMLEHNGTDLTIFDAYVTRKKRRMAECKADEKSIEKLEAIESHLTLLEDKIFRYVIQNHCIICGQPHLTPSVLSCCQHVFCGKCVDGQCPLCRTPDPIKVELALKEFSETNVVHLSNASNVFLKRDKISTLLEIIGNAVDKKILIFSNYNETFTILKKFLEDRKLVYLELRGTKEKRDNTIDSYKTGVVNILLLNTIHSGAGLNLQETTDIILYHKIHEFQKIQVIGRANRIGRKCQLTVHYLE